MKLKRSAAEYLRSVFPALAVTAAFWLILQIPACFGFRPAILWPFYFLSGALAGITGSSVLGMIGGAIGRAVIFVFFEHAIWILLFSKKPVKERFLKTGKLLAGKLTNLIPFCRELKSLITTDLAQIGIACIGTGTAVILSHFLSGNGTLVNSFSSIALLITITEELQTHEGLIYSTVKKLSALVKMDEADRFLKAHGLGYALSLFLKGAKVMRITGILFIAAGVILIIVSRKKKEKVNA